jgi:hypothetical protein
MTRLREKIAVPELEPASVQRAERRVLAAVAATPLRASERRVPWLAVAVAVAGILVAAAIGIGSGVRDRVVAGIGGEVRGPWQLVTGEDAVTLRLGDALVRLAPRTEVAVVAATNGAGIEVVLGRGRVDCEVEPRQEREPFRVTAGDVAVDVVGTVFSVERAEEVRVGVERGKVSVRSRAGEVTLAAGQAWSERDGVTTTIAMGGPPPQPSPRKRGEGGMRSDVSAAPESSSAGADAGASASAGAVAGAGAGAGAGANAGANAGGPSRPRGQRATREPASKGQRPPRHAAPERRSDLLEAMTLEESDPAAAARRYALIAARTRGGTASYALYSQAYVEYFRLRRRTAALETLDLFRRRFPRSREAESALWLQTVALCAGVDAEPCRASAYSYLQRFRGGAFATEAEKIVNR